MIRSPNVSALVAGLALLVLGILLVLDADGSIHLGFAYMGPAIVGALGTIVLASGLETRARGRD
jgi:hypothetical protein